MGAQATAACMDKAAVAGTLLVVSAKKAVAAEAGTQKVVAVHAAAGDVEAAAVAT